MNNGIDLVALATEITRQKTAKTDYLVANSAINMVTDGGIDGNKPNIEIQIDGVDNFSVTDHAHAQLGANLKIPAAYYQKMLSSSPDLIRGQDYTQWGALNAVTEMANHNKSYERSTELETIGGQILNLSPRDWHEIAYFDKAA
jgi:hypothetical protein